MRKELVPTEDFVSMEANASIIILFENKSASKNTKIQIFFVGIRIYKKSGEQRMHHIFLFINFRCKDGFHGVRCEYKTRPFLHWPH